MVNNSIDFPVDAAARRPVKQLFAICILLASSCLVLWFLWPEQTNWLIRGAGIGMLAMAVLLAVVLVTPSLHEKMNKL